ncbi:MAG: hypothetical protein KGL63_11660 [Betaproteobacteria bacterium]|nr:hypothetical protein [Betaproteobacteria bacterium]
MDWTICWTKRRPPIYRRWRLSPLASILPRLGMEPAQARQSRTWTGRALPQQRYVRQDTSARLRRLVDIAVAQTLHSSALNSTLVPTPAQRVQLR